MSVLPALRRSLLSTHPWVLEAMVAPTRAAVSQLMRVVAHCLADALTHGDARLVAHYELILRQLHEIWVRWRGAPSAIDGLQRKPGRLPRSYSIPDAKLWWDMVEARTKLIAKGDAVTQERLIAKMGYGGSARRVREWCQRLRIDWDVFRQP